jgi:hypothetical protein
VILNDINEDKKNKTKLFETAREQNKEMFLIKKEEVHLKQEEVRLRDGDLRLREKTFRLKEEREEKDFMFMNTSLLDEDMLESIRQRKKAIRKGQKGNP